MVLFNITGSVFLFLMIVIGNAPDWELSFYVPIVNLSQSSKVGRIAMANNATNANIATSALLPTTPTKPIFLTRFQNNPTDQRGIRHS